MPRPAKPPYLGKKPSSPNWYIFWSRGGRRHEKSTGTQDIRTAEKTLNYFLSEFVARNRLPDGCFEPRDYMIIDALERYSDEYAQQNVKDKERLRYSIKALLSFWIDYTVADVNNQTCNDYMTFRKCGAGTIRRELNTLRAAINYEYRNGRLARPVTVFLPPAPPSKERFLTRDEVARLLRAAKQNPYTRHYLPLFIILALYTGSRKQAIMDLKWSQIDFEAERINLQPEGRKQTNKRRPILPMPYRLATFLKLAYRRRYPDCEYVVNHGGKPIQNLRRSFAHACKIAGFDDVTPHVLRHTAATFLAQKGVSIYEIARWLGHSVARTTELYAHHHPDFMSQARDAFDRPHGGKK